MLTQVSTGVTGPVRDLFPGHVARAGPPLSAAQAAMTSKRAGQPIPPPTSRPNK